jgi:hypothetical protein
LTQGINPPAGYIEVTGSTEAGMYHKMKLGDKVTFLERKVNGKFEW